MSFSKRKKGDHYLSLGQISSLQQSTHDSNGYLSPQKSVTLEGWFQASKARH